MQKNKYEKIICSAPKRAALIIVSLPSYKGDARPARSNRSLGHPTSADIATAPPAQP